MTGLNTHYIQRAKSCQQWVTLFGRDEPHLVVNSRRMENRFASFFICGIHFALQNVVHSRSRPALALAEARDSFVDLAVKELVFPSEVFRQRRARQHLEAVNQLGERDLELLSLVNSDGLDGREIGQGGKLGERNAPVSIKRRSQARLGKQEV